MLARNEKTMQARFEVETIKQDVVPLLSGGPFAEFPNMAELFFRQRDGSVKKIDAKPGVSVMQLAIQENIRGIDAECGGACACATCHVYIDEAHIPLLPAPADDEAEMLDGVAAERRETSRLACQVIVSDALDGMVIEVPERQF
ncbi:2Fe-2S iron-sulfur cluster-binding protein [Acetobacter vaccinii]|nr:2Fe-2S iron-sulfur cluster-binding protein [Acetobacter vaccinii]